MDAEWTYHWNGEKLDAKPKFKIEVTGSRCKACESGECEISGKIEVYIKTKFGKPIKDLKCILITENGDEIKKTTDDNGLIKEEDLIPGYISIKPDNEE